MPFLDHQILNWTQHDAKDGACRHCGLAIPQLHAGVLWMKGTLMLSMAPHTNWVKCGGRA